MIGSHSAFQSGCLLFIALCKMCAWQTSCRTILAGGAAPSPVHPPALAHFGIEPACAIRPFRRSITSWTWRFPPLHQGRTMGNRFGRLITSQGPSSYPTPMTRKTSVPPLPIRPRAFLSSEIDKGLSRPSSMPVVSAGVMKDLSRGNHQATGTRLLFSRGSGCPPRKELP